jgi:hypothetical protein
MAKANPIYVTAVGYFIDGNQHAGLMGQVKAALPVAINALRKSEQTVDLGMADHLETFAALLERVRNEILMRDEMNLPIAPERRCPAHIRRTLPAPDCHDCAMLQPEPTL